VCVWVGGGGRNQIYGEFEKNKPKKTAMCMYVYKNKNIKNVTRCRDSRSAKSIGTK